MKKLILFCAGLAALASFGGFSYQSTMTVGGYEGSTDLTGFPVLVRISPERISGFSYDDLQARDGDGVPDGRDIAFYSEDGGTLYPHEIDTWTTNGESLVWVRLPVLSGQQTKFLFRYANPDVTSYPDATQVWRGAMGGNYGGVWHLGESNGKARAEDSAKLVADKDNALYTYAGSQGSWSTWTTATGVVGTARSTGQCHCLNGDILVCSNMNACAFGKVFTVSGWAIAPSNMYAACYNGKRHGFTHYSREKWGLAYETKEDTPYSPTIQHRCDKGYGTKLPLGEDDFCSWIHVAMVSSANELLCYTNGVLCGCLNSSVYYGDEGSTLFTIGGISSITDGGGGTRWSMIGHWDEQRYLGATASADWIKAEHDAVAVSSFVTSSPKSDTPSCSLFVTSTLPDLGETATDPVYGVHALVAGVAKTCTAPTADVEIDLMRHWAYMGWTLYRQEGTDWVEVESGVGNVCTFTPADKSTMKLVWNAFYKRPLTLTISGEGMGTLAVDGETVSSGKAWVAEGAHALSVVPDASSSFVVWTGDSEALANPNDAATTLTLLAPCALAANLASASHVPQTLKWQGTPGGNLMDAANWGGAVPAPGDTLYITNAGDRVVMNVSTPRFKKIVVGGGPGTASLVCSNWVTRLNAETVEVAANGTIAAVGALSDGEMSNRVWIAANTLTVLAGGTISADSAGYRAQHGPAWVGASKDVLHDNKFSKFGGAYGGEQGYPACDTSNPINGKFPSYVPPHPYGDITWPYDPGCGPGTEGSYNAGGGAICLEVSGTVTVNGVVTASASSETSKWTNGSTYLPYGSGGGIVITCSSIAGAGKVLANGGGNVDRTGYARVSGGAGGRIAVHYDAAAQATANCTVRFEALGRAGGRVDEDYANGRGRLVYLSSPGTLWFTDNRFLTDERYLAAGMPLAGEWHSGVALNALHYSSSVLFRDTLLKFPTDGFDFAVAGSLTMTSRASGYEPNELNALVFSNATVSVSDDLSMTNTRLTMVGGALTVGGNVTLRNPGTGFPYGAVLHVTAMPTNAPDSFGATVEVGGSADLSRLCYIYAMSDPDNGAIPHFHMKDLLVGERAYVTSERGGWAPKKGPGYAATAGSYGGRAGRFDNTGWDYSKAGPTYGDWTLPLEPGSGGGFDRGGGVIFIEADKSIEIKKDGFITVDSKSDASPWDGYCGTGSAGAIVLKTRKIFGKGSVTAASGCYPGISKNGYHGSGPGGGGRIAIYYVPRRSVTNELFVAAPAGNSTSSHKAAEAGTVYWGDATKTGLLLIVR